MTYDSFIIPTIESFDANAKYSSAALEAYGASFENYSIAIEAASGTELASAISGMKKGDVASAKKSVDDAVKSMEEETKNAKDIKRLKIIRNVLIAALVASIGVIVILLIKKKKSAGNASAEKALAADLKRQLDEERAKNKTLDKTLNSVHDDIADLSSQNLRLQRNNSRAERSTTAMKQNNESLEQEKTKLEASLREFKGNFDKLAQYAKALQSAGSEVNKDSKDIVKYGYMSNRNDNAKANSDRFDKASTDLDNFLSNVKR